MAKAFDACDSFVPWYAVLFMMDGIRQVIFLLGEQILKATPLTEEWENKLKKWIDIECTAV